ncbi:MAG: hypothetical protein WBD99_14055 [Thermodesulfobacteriota bacterium]
MNEKKKRIRNQIRSLYNGSLRKPSNVAKEHPRLYSNARKAFGSWKKALEACEIDYEKARNHEKWSRERVAKEIERLYLSGHTLRPKDLKKGGATKLISAATYHFGSWSKAVKHSRLYYSFEENNNKTVEIDIWYNEFRTKQGVK